MIFNDYNMGNFNLKFVCMNFLYCYELIWFLNFLDGCKLWIIECLDFFVFVIFLFYFYMLVCYDMCVDFFVVFFFVWRFYVVYSLFVVEKNCLIVIFLMDFFVFLMRYIMFEVDYIKLGGNVYLIVVGVD